MSENLPEEYMEYMIGAEDLEKYHDEIVFFLQKYGNLNKVSAEKLLKKSNILPNLDDDADTGVFFHEEPYYWAMTLIQTEPKWYKNPDLWPPPEDRYD